MGFATEKPLAIKLMPCAGDHRLQEGVFRRDRETVGFKKTPFGDNGGPPVSRRRFSERTGNHRNQEGAASRSNCNCNRNCLGGCWVIVGLLKNPQETPTITRPPPKFSFITLTVRRVIVRVIVGSFKEISFFFFNYQQLPSQLPASLLR